MFKNLKIGPKVLIAVSLILLVMTSAFYLIGRSAQNKTFELEILEQTQATYQRFENLKERDTHILASALDVFLENQEFKNVYLEKDRDKLYDYGQPLFQSLKENHSITHFYFHLPDGSNFVRLHNNDIHGDNITRLTFYEARDTKELGAGIELGKTAYALRTVMPYYNNGELIGYVEFGEEIDHFLEILKGETSDDFAVLADKSYLNKEDWVSVRQTAGLGDNWDDMEDYVLLSETIVEESAAAACFVEENAELAKKEVVVIKKIKIGDKSFACAGFPILNPKGKDIGAVLMLDDVSNFVTVANKANINLLGTSAVLFILSVFLFSFLISRMVTKPITQARNTAVEIARGNMDIEIDTSSRDEIGELARAIDKMRISIKAVMQELEKRISRK